MPRAHVVVEGQTEETFVRTLLAPHLAARGLQFTVSIVTTKRTRAGRHYRGGMTSYSKLRNDVAMFLGNPSLACVTTMVDYYALPDDFPGQPPPPGPALQRVTFLQEALAADIHHPRFIPFLTLHEFEALLFSDPAAIAAAFPEANVAAELHAIRRAYPSPEAINTGRDTHPSQRILTLLPSYHKRSAGTIIAKRIGLAAIRAQCPHFDAWVTRLEGLAPTA